MQAGLPVGGMVHPMALSEHLDEQRRQRAVVLDQQQPGPIGRRRAAGPARCPVESVTR